MTEEVKDIIKQYFENDNEFIEKLSYKDFFDKVCKKRNSSDNEKVILVEYDRENPKAFTYHFFETILSNKVALILDKNDKNKIQKLQSISLRYNNIKNQKIKNRASIIIQTSGSSGKPKEVLYDLKCLILSAKETIDHYKIQRHEKWGITLPLNHIGGLMIIFRNILLNAKLHFLNPGSLDQNTIDKLDYLSLVPTQLHKALRDKIDFSRLKGIVLGGAKANEEDLNQFANNNINLAYSYGMSETCAQICSTPFTTDIKTLKTSGRPIGANKIFIEENTLVIQSNRLALCYLGEEPFNKKFKTQDIGYFDDSKNLIITGRIDDVIISGGENINLSTLDDKIKKILKIEKSLSLKIDDNYYGQIPFSLIYLKSVQSAQSDFEMTSVLKKELLNYEVPRKFFNVVDLKLSSKNQLKISHGKKNELIHSIKQYKFLQDLGINCLHFGDPRLKPLFVTHGFMGSHKDFKFLLDQRNILEKYHIILIDLPGHGKTNLNNDQSNMTELCHDLSQGFNTINNDLSFLGYSLGGRVIYEIAKKLNKPANIILESSSIGIENEEDKKKRLNFDTNLFNDVNTAHDFNNFLDKWYENPIFKGLTIKEIERLKSRRSFKDLEMYKKSVVFYSPSHQSYLKERDFPVNHNFHYIYGEHDQKYKDLHKFFTNNYEIKKSSHNTHIMNRNSYIETLKSVLLK